jgi:hypothetical protein
MVVGAGPVKNLVAYGVAVVVIALAQLSAAGTAVAASALQMTVLPGFNGVVRPGNWVPVEINLANSGPTLSGNVAIIVQRRPSTATSGAVPATIEYSVPVALPEHSSKRFSTAVFVPPFYDQLQVRLLSGNQTVESQNINLQRVDPSQLFCGVLASDPSAFDSLSALSVGDSQRQPQLITLDLPDLPTNPQLLASLDCLIVSDYATRTMSALQQTALVAWVSNGGVLAIGTGPAGASTLAGFPAGFLPASVDGTAPLRSLSSLTSYTGVPTDQTGPWLIANLKLGDGLTVIADESQPVLVVGKRGHGAVFMLALSLVDKPLRGWSGMDNLWSSMLTYVPSPTASYSTYFRQDYGWGRLPREALTSGGTGSGPEAQVLLLGLLGFGLLVGPVNLLVLSRLGRRELALLTVPLLAIGSTVVALTYADQHRQGDVVVNQVSIVRTWDGSGVGEMHSYVGVFALHPQTYQLQLPTNALLSGSFYPLQGALPRSTTTTPLRVQTAGLPEVQGLDLQPGQLTSFTLDSHTNDPGRVAGPITLAGDQLTGDVVNGLGVTIHDAAVVAGSSVQQIGDLRSGGSHAVSLRLGSGTPTGFGQAADIVDRLFPGLARTNAGQRNLKYSVIAAALNPALSTAGQVDLGGFSLMGWIDGPLDPVRDPGTGRDAHQQILFITGLPLRVPGQLQDIPNQLLDRVQLSSSYSARVDSTGITVTSGDTAAFQYSAPIDPAHFAVRSLTLATSTDSPAPATLEMFNWRSQAWEQVPFAVGSLAIPNPERYFSTTGTIRLRLHYRQTPGVGPSSITFSRFLLSVGGVSR